MADPLTTEELLDLADEMLDRLARPVWWLQEDADREGNHISGAAAVGLASNAGWLCTQAARHRDELRTRRSRLAAGAGEREAFKAGVYYALNSTPINPLEFLDAEVDRRFPAPATPPDGGTKP